MGDRYRRPGEEINVKVDALTVVYSTLPRQEDDGAVHLLGDGKVLFDVEVSRQDILE